MPRKANVSFEGDNATLEWLGGQKLSTRSNYSACWRHFLRFMGMSGDEIFASRKTDTTSTWEKKLLPFKQYMKEQGKSDLYARGATVGVRSFFAYHRMPLKMTHMESGKLRQSRRVTEDYKFSKEDLQKMADYSDIEEQFVIVVGKSLGLRAGDFSRLERGNFDSIDLNQPAPVFLGEYQTQKPELEEQAEPSL